MGNPDATEAELWDALRAVSAESLIAHLENGLDTDVGEGGKIVDKAPTASFWAWAATITTCIPDSMKTKPPPRFLPNKAHSP